MSLYKETKFIMQKYGIAALKRFGQNFLIDDEVVENIIKASQLTKEDTVIEIGPGLGTLTKSLCESSKQVIAIEIDRKMIEILNDRFELYDNFKLINEDVLKIDLNKLIGNTTNVKVIANLPYYITTPIVMKLLEEKLNIDSITVMVQKEVAERIVAIPGSKNYGALSIAVQFYTNPKLSFLVPKESFEPAPSITSAVLHMNVLKKPSVNVENEKLFFNIVKAAFSQRRKTLLNSISNSNIIGNNKSEVTNILNKSGINQNQRAEELSLQDYANITNIVDENNN